MRGGALSKQRYRRATVSLATEVNGRFILSLPETIEDGDFEGVFGRLEVGGDAVLLPVAKTRRVRPVAAADLGSDRVTRILLSLAARLGLGQSTFGGRRQGALLRVAFHGSKRDWLLPSLFSI